MMQNNFLKTLKGKKTKPTPVWFMRQAGRYLKEYQALKEKYSFLDMCKNPDLATKITLMPAKLGVDALIIFSDILIPLLAAGAKLSYNNGQPSVKMDLNFSCSHLESVEFVGNAIKLVKKEKPDMPLLGFAATPFTLMCYIFGGQDFSNIRAFMLSKPEKFKEISEKITSLTVEYLNFQIKSGCDAVQLFDSWGGMLKESTYKEFSLPYIKKITQNTKAPLIYFIKNSSHLNHLLKETGADCLSIDDKTPLKTIHKLTTKAVQGNLDNAVLLTEKDTIKKEALKVLNDAENIPHIFNLSHGILKNTNEDNVKFLVDLVHNETSK